MLANDIKVKSHNGVKQKLGEQFVSKGRLSKVHARTFNLLSDFRHKGDYDNLFEFDVEMVEKLIEPTKDFIKAIDSLVSDVN